MNCYHCGSSLCNVVDSRPAGDGSITRRRYQCHSCLKRFTTLEIAAADNLRGGAALNAAHAWASLTRACLPKLTDGELLAELQKRQRIEP